MSDMFDDDVPGTEDLGTVDHLTVGTEGEPGRRVFFLQLATAGRALTVKVEKQQVAALATYLFELLDDLAEIGPLPHDIEPRPFGAPEWVVGSLGVAYDAGRDRLVFVMEEVDRDGEEGRPVLPRDRVRFTATKEQATALAARGTELVEAGRPPCPLCSRPLDPRGHICPRTNGHAKVHP